MTDFLLAEKIYKMITAVPKPRLLFKKGICAKGFFSPYMTFDQYTDAEVFCNTEIPVPITVRFSSMLGDEGTADTRRNIKGMAVKFHCSEKDYDLICHSLPVFFTDKNDDIQKLVEIFSKRYMFDGINSKALWQFAVDHPYAINCIIRMYSHEGLLDSFLRNNWFSSGTYIWEKGGKGKAIVRYKWIPVSKDSHSVNKGSKGISPVSAEFMAGFDPHKAHEEMEEAVMNGNFPSYELQVQMADYESVSNTDYIKSTLCWKESIHRPVPIGLMKITEIENSRKYGSDGDVCFAPGNTIKGISLCEYGIAGTVDYAYRIFAANRGVEI